ncbi:uncharacterized protein LOC131299614 [Rhododendron vialii]|uniref:uncharacterized protein LOC131299614 n=1 Tax=Rhododendron vialii TaxID=182163 RepID=UPI00265EC005|nr:uncharacterized protein LOC131299614 [Rhododendron vialii]
MVIDNMDQRHENSLVQEVCTGPRTNEHEKLLVYGIDKEPVTCEVTSPSSLFGNERAEQGENFRKSSIRCKEHSGRKKRGCEKEVCNEGIAFIDEDLGGVQVPHNDALVITLLIGEYDMERILVDSGSYTMMRLRRVVWPMGKVTLPVRAGTVVLRTDFLVVDVPSSYNAIIVVMRL